MAHLQIHQTNPLPRMKIAVLGGGTSAEREVSLKSASAVTQALTKRGHAVTSIDPQRTNLESVDWSEYEAVFIALHGTFGEDGQVQRILETAQIPFTGSGSMVSRLAFSKSASKERFIHSEVPTLPYVLIHETDDAARIQQQATSIGFPCVIKPDAQGSSFGVSLVHSLEELPQALTYCFHHDAFGVIEPYVAGTEWTVSMIDKTVLPPIRIETNRTFFDFHAKYEDENTRHIFPSDVSAKVVAAITAAGQRACESIGTHGLVRADIMVDRYSEPWVLEVNTIPGLTSHSLLPKAAAHAGICFEELCETAIQSAISHAGVTFPSRRKIA